MPVEKRTAGAPLTVNHPGPYIATVVNHLDPRYSGSLEVQLESNVLSGPDKDSDNQIVVARYLMPFYGINSVESNTKNDTYSTSQQSYGMWFVPPDPGSKVMVIFAENQINQCFWIGCVADEYMNFMVPDGRASTRNIATDPPLPEEYKDKSLPAGEYNKKIQRTGNDADAFARPHNPLFAGVLNTQGLLSDEVRGTTTTSARRNIPSTVFGVNTPGPLDKRDGAPKGKYGAKGIQIDYFRSRLGGSSFVMDDGDPRFLRKGPAGTTAYEYADKEAGDTEGDQTLPQNELLRLRTRTGHQILLHNTEDLIYIANAKGTAWIELSSNGKIDIHSEDSISIHSGNDINMRADRDINMEARRNVNVKATGEWGIDPLLEKGRIQLESAGNYNLIIGSNGKITTSGQFDVNTTGNNNFTTGASTNIKSGAGHVETAPRIDMNGPEAATAATASPLSTFTLQDDDATPIQQSIMKRIPQHEPWQDHENLDPNKVTPLKTDREIPDA